MAWFDIWLDRLTFLNRRAQEARVQAEDLGDRAELVAESIGPTPEVLQVEPAVEVEAARGQMRWQREENGSLKLYLKSDGDLFWRPYHGHPMSQPDCTSDMGSPGIRTFHHLHKLGWELLAVRE